jgi:hypothetical protein
MSVQNIHPVESVEGPYLFSRGIAPEPELFIP